ncbi:hypothetical protein ACWEO4_06980 [Streptomyces sp. NPDC004393]
MATDQFSAALGGRVGLETPAREIRTAWKNRCHAEQSATDLDD